MPPRRAPSSHSPTKTIEVVDPRWLLQAGFLAIVAALLCAWLTLCLLFYQGQWQIALHPTRTSTPPPAFAQLVHFGAAETGTPQLTGWWIPATPTGRYANFTLLYLPSGDGSLISHTAALLDLHNLGINVFAVDYRGYGQSADRHPTQRRMQEDAGTAFDYLTASRALQPTQIIPYGVGLGAALAAQFAADHPGLPALILDTPDGDLLDRARHDPRGSLIPVRMLFHERFPLARNLATLQLPKLFIFYADTRPSLRAAMHATANPKMTFELPAPAGTDLPSRDHQAITRFLDQYLPV